MEKIKINSIEKKMSRTGKPFWVVKYNDSGDATIGAWDAQLANYIEKNVGIGGTVSVVITQKGEYTNITDVDMTSGVKGETTSSGSLDFSSKGTEVTAKPNNREKSIVAQVLVKARWYGDSEATNEKVLESYNFFLEKLNDA